MTAIYIGMALVFAMFIIQRFEVKGKYLLVGIPWAAATALIVALDRVAIRTQTEGWCLMGVMLTMLYLFGTAFFVGWIGSEEKYW